MSTIVRFCFRDLCDALNNDSRAIRATRSSLSDIRLTLSRIATIEPTAMFADSRMMIDVASPTTLFMHNLTSLCDLIRDALRAYDCDSLAHEPLCLVHDVDPDTITRDPLHTLFLYIDLYVSSRDPFVILPKHAV